MIIGLYGDSRSGKDTIAQILESKGFEWRSFAATLRKLLERIDPWLIDSEELGIKYEHAIREFGLDFVKKTWPESVEYMIRLGQGVRDIIHEDAWIWPVMRDLPEKMVISDVRQPNEYETITQAGGEVWRVVRPGTIRRGMDGLLDDYHFPVTIHNSGSSDDLRDIINQEVENALQNRCSRSWSNDGTSVFHDQ